MAFFGLIGLTLAFVGILISIVALGVGQFRNAQALKNQKEDDLVDTLFWGGRVAAILSICGLTLSCAVLAVCFLTGDVSIQYVLDNRSNATGDLAWLYKISGLWAGRQGSLLFWAWLIAIFNLIVALRDMKSLRAIDSVALLVSQIVLGAFVCVLLFSEDNMPFILTSEKYLVHGQLTAAGSVLGMNSLLEHWAMAVHPPTLFVGYAGLTIPFAYALASLIVGDISKTWIERSSKYALFSWVFLGIGIGLGAVWAYVVLGWGGYWGWDPVENASLLPWLMGLALIHSFTAVRARGVFKGWTILCAALTFAFVIVGTFISRSGIVQSVHAFEGDPVSLIFFLALIVLSLIAVIIGLVFRRDLFAQNAVEEAESMFSKEGLYYINNLLLVLVTVLLTYMTVSSALPSWMPLGGQSISSGTYNAIARPLTVIYLILVALGPIVAWGKTDKAKFISQIKIPMLCSGVLFVGLLVYYVFNLLPVYDAAVQQGGSVALSFTEQGPGWWYNGVAVLGLAAASFLFFNALMMLVRNFKAKKKRLSGIGAAVSHTAMAVILVGLIGSGMYVTDGSGYMAFDPDTDTAGETFQVKGYELSYTNNNVTELDNGTVIYQVEFDVTKDGAYVGHVSPSVELVTSTQQQKLNASVIGTPAEDLFVVYRGVNPVTKAFSLNVLVNPLISLVWGGFVLLIAGGVIAMFGKKASRNNNQDSFQENL